MYGYSALSGIESGTRALSRRGGRYSDHAWPCHTGSSRHLPCCEVQSEERSAGCVRKADVSLPVEVRSGQSRAVTGSVPATAVMTTRARGFMPCAFAYSGEVTSTAEAPSTTPEEFPAWCTWLISGTSG